ncbi:fimbrial protein [Paraburkholderia rhizosphaerae]|uniref:fimbrial protein n=1 Tax=Paraburkholderia rhizosphaerae TaxID=480658 RepID=UPI001416FEF0|nr:fimbrial protein [Paraburkholderia rhizosphaerae]
MALRTAALALIGSLLAPAAHATCKFASGGPVTVTIPVDAVVNVPRDAPNGTVVYTSPYITSAPTGKTSCSNDPFGVQSLIGTQPAAMQTVFPIGNTGLSFSWKYVDSGSVYSWVSYGSAKGNGGGSTTMPNAFQLIKTGPIAAGATVPGGAVAVLKYGTLAVTTMSLANPISVGQASCATPNVTATLGTHNLSELAAVGSTTSSTKFSIALNNCPSGINTIKYQIDPTTTLLDSANSVVALDSGSTASGAGVQLLDAAGKAVPLSKQIAFTDFVPGAAGSYTLPLSARYYRTGATRAGTANSSMTFTINYQ